jgi:hypothetical protein
VFTARYALNPYIKQIRFVFKGLISILIFSHLCLFLPSGLIPSRLPTKNLHGFISSPNVPHALFILLCCVVLWMQLIAGMIHFLGVVWVCCKTAENVAARSCRTEKVKDVDRNIAEPKPNPFTSADRSLCQVVIRQWWYHPGCDTKLILRVTIITPTAAPNHIDSRCSLILFWLQAVSAI